ncbi:DUF4238 domain-containing protein [Xylanibacter brevis]|uniref:DUF4238 domain-containing protein n=1 Tax=Xylanibacter brevis TaxID=83231 RepID=UPI0009DCB855|nr:DUF4238 domain-containing protein [Xylanibacter brevis]
MAEKKNHHFVPQSYQRLFSNDGKSIGVYNIKKNLLINQSSIKNTMSKDYFYSKDQNVEDALAEIERLCMLAFHKLDNNNDYNLHEVERLNILTYVMMQLGRTVFMSERLSDDVNEMSLEIFKRCTGMEQVDPHLEFRFDEPSLFSLSVYAGMVVNMADLSFKLVCIDSKCESTFISSDCPAFIINPYFDFLGYAGVKILGYKGVCIMMPLTPRLLILFYDSSVYKIGNRKGKVMISESKEIETINMLIANEANELLVFNPKHAITSSLKVFAQKAKSNNRPFKLYYNTQCKIRFFHILDKAKSLNINSCFQEDLFREYTNYLSKNPDIKNDLEKLGGSASEEDRRNFYEELKKRR